MKKKKKNSNQLRKETKAKLRKIGKRNRKFVHLVCTQCGREFKINTNPGNYDLWTEEIKKHYVCLICR